MEYLTALTFLLTPAYVARFNVFGLPSNLLMLWILAFWLIFFVNLLLNKKLSVFFTAVKNTDKKTLWLISLFFISGIISLFIRGFGQEKLGQFIVLFLQPISMFFISGYIFWKNPEKKSLLLTTCYLLLAVMGLYAIVQYFTLLGLPPAYWGNSIEPKRAIAFFSHPNFYALFSAPLLALLIPDLGFRVKDKGLRIKDVRLWAWLFGLIGLFLSMSRAGWLGLGIAGLIYLFIAADKSVKKITSVIVIVMVIIIISVPNLRWRFTLPFYGEKSAVSRISLWNTGWKGVKESPIFGLGLTGFANEWPKLNSDPGLTDTHNFPHNIFLNFWVETGALGLISLIGLMSLLIYRGLRPTVISEFALSGYPEFKKTDSRFRGNDIIKLGVSLFLITLITQGLIDNPYFKNDLAMVFWIILSMF